MEGERNVCVCVFFFFVFFLMTFITQDQSYVEYSKDYNRCMLLNSVVKISNEWAGGILF